MHLIPTPEEALSLMREAGALRIGHFAYGDLHSDQHLEASLALCYHRLAKTLTVGLSRLLRANPDVRQMIPQLSMVAATVAGLPVAHGLCEALGSHQVYWAEKDSRGAGMRLPQYLEHTPGERVLLVDDILRSGKLLREAQKLLESIGCQVVGAAVLFHQPTPRTMDFGTLPIFYLAELEAGYYAEADECELCQRGIPLQNVEADEKTEEAREAFLLAGV